MEKRIFNNDTLKMMSLFTSITQTSLKDCIELDSKIIFIVDENQAGKAIGKRGINVKRLEDALKRKIMIAEYNSDIIQFVKNIIYPNKASNIILEGKTIIITPVDTFTRGMLIGRNATNLREYEKIIKRYFDIDEIKIK